jgi:hypothetical protein
MAVTRYGIVYKFAGYSGSDLDDDLKPSLCLVHCWNMVL